MSAKLKRFKVVFKGNYRFANATDHHRAAEVAYEFLSSEHRRQVELGLADPDPDLENLDTFRQVAGVRESPRY